MKKIVYLIFSICLVCTISFAEDASQKLSTRQQREAARLDSELNAINASLEAKIKRAEAQGKSVDTLEKKRREVNKRYEIKRKQLGV